MSFWMRQKKDVIWFCYNLEMLRPQSVAHSKSFLLKNLTSVMRVFWWPNSLTAVQPLSLTIPSLTISATKQIHDCHPEYKTSRFPLIDLSYIYNLYNGQCREFFQVPLWITNCNSESKEHLTHFKHFNPKQRKAKKI